MCLQVDADRNLAQILQRLDVALAAHHELGLGHLDQPAAHVDVAALNGLFDLGQGHTVGAQFFGIDLDLVLPHKAAHRGDLGDAGHAHQLVAQIPVLLGSQHREIQARKVGGHQQLFFC